ncbi:hypothetical protein BO71DRAFT_430373 [Aspergillus ellipticus CBS 707.79]|uniref:Uncharacterized protein n=1 Tax=Aspergillus ellipticus CBS 707.79 TaxID=1448320 RepID=A0A319DIX9_9EURO|nr:hypothetical protein BO71DRAFT_430373 [Aspergillus ellipticus CBS 707.79]
MRVRRVQFFVSPDKSLKASGVHSRGRKGGGLVPSGPQWKCIMIETPARRVHTACFGFSRIWGDLLRRLRSLVLPGVADDPRKKRHFSLLALILILRPNNLLLLHYLCMFADNLPHHYRNSDPAPPPIAQYWGSPLV